MWQTISYSTAQITDRLHENRDVVERLTKVGLLIAVIAVVLAPFNLLVSYYGLNVEEFSTDAKLSLYSFWRFGMPLVLLTLVTICFIGVWLWTNGRRPR